MRKIPWQIMSLVLVFISCKGNQDTHKPSIKKKNSSPTILTITNQTIAINQFVFHTDDKNGIQRMIASIVKKSKTKSSPYRIPNDIKWYIAIDKQVEVRKLIKLLQSLYKISKESWVKLVFIDYSPEVRMNKNDSFIVRLPRRTRTGIKKNNSNIIESRNEPLNTKSNLDRVIAKAENSNRIRYGCKEHSKSNPYAIESKVIVKSVQNGINIYESGYKTGVQCKSRGISIRGQQTIFGKTTARKCLQQISREDRCLINLIVCIPKKEKVNRLLYLLSLNRNIKNKQLIFPEVTLSFCQNNWLND